MGYLELLRTEPRFRTLWLAQIVSEAGDWLQFVALLQLFPTEGRGAELLAGLLAIRLLPSIVWAPVAGVVADRFPRGRVMIAADLARALVVLGYLFVRGPEDAPLVYALLFTQESLTAFFEPARAASTPLVVSRKGLLAANALSGATWSSMLAIGAFAGGLIASAIGARAAFLANSASFVLSAIFVALTRVPRLAKVAEQGAKKDRFGLTAVRDGAAYLKRSAPQAAATSVKALWGAAGGVIFFYSVYATDVFARPALDAARATGFLYAARGVGAFVGPLVARRVLGESVRALRRSIQIAFFVAAISIALFATSRDVWTGVLFVFFIHAGGSTCWVSSTQLLQLTVPSGFLGRVFAVEIAGFTLSQASSSLLAGFLVGHQILGKEAAIRVIAGLAVAAGVAWFLAMRRLGARLDAEGSKELSA